MHSKTYSELKNLKTFKERFDYLKLNGKVGSETFGYDRILNQVLYKSDKWKRVRDKVIIRDEGNDLGIEGYPIGGHIVVHHMNPITVEDVLNQNEKIFDPEYLISVSDLTHKAIQYTKENILEKEQIERAENDTCPWK